MYLKQKGELDTKDTKNYQLVHYMDFTQTEVK